MIDIAKQLNPLSLDGIEFHQRKGIVASMHALMIEVGKIFEVRKVPREAASAEHENTWSLLDGFDADQMSIGLQI